MPGSEIHHQKFLHNLARSQAAVLRAAEVLIKRGNQVVINPTTYAPTHGEWAKHADQGDIFVMSRIEVKRLSAEFTDDPKSWPFPDFIVCAKHSWDTAKQKPLAFIYFSKDMTHYAILESASKGSWWTSQRNDRRYPGYKQEFYVCSPTMAIFMKTNEQGGDTVSTD